MPYSATWARSWQRPRAFSSKARAPASSFNNQGSFTKSTGTRIGDFGPGISFNVAGGSVDMQLRHTPASGRGHEHKCGVYDELGATLDIGGTSPFSLDSSSPLSALEP